MKPTLKIIGSYTSPFVRAVRIACEELELVYELEVTSFFAKNTPEQNDFIKQNNPLMRVPVLVDGVDNIIDSRIIIQHLVARYGNGKEFAKSFPLSIKQENILTTIYGVIDAGVLWFILKNTQPEINLAEGYAARSLERVHSGLAWLDKQKDIGQNFGAVESLLVCAVEWLRKRNVVDCSGYQNIMALHETFAERDAVVKTRIPDSA